MNILNIRDRLTTEGVIFFYSGVISVSFTKYLIDTVAIKFEEEGHDKNVVKSIFQISIELLQNVMSYSKEKVINENNKYSSTGIYSIGFDTQKEKYYIYTSNEIDIKDQEKLQTKLDTVNTLDEKQLKKLIREKIRSADDAHDRGAGIGILKVAQRSKDKIEYLFQEKDEKLYFNIIVYI